MILLTSLQLHCGRLWQNAYGALEHRNCRRMLWCMDAFRQIVRNPAAAPRRVAGKLWRTAQNRHQAWRDARTPSYISSVPQGEPRSCFAAPLVETLRPHAAIYAVLAQLTLEHRFDLLGSGWVQLDRGQPRQGFGGSLPTSLEPVPDAEGAWLARAVSPNNLPFARRLRSSITPGFRPISWNEDFKTGFVWPATTPSRALRYGDRQGVDVKTPWELARMQHLPWLVFAAMLSRDGQPGFEQPELYLAEIRDQILDFASACPPRFGPNWLCTMDVAIRAANIIATHDMLESAGLSLGKGFKRQLLRLMADHFSHIVNNLEYQPVVRANHYYSDVVGLLFVAAWLPESPVGNAALAWSVQEYMRESVRQFGADGANFEASTSYHRLCGELLVYGAALIKGLSPSTVAGMARAESAHWTWNPPLEPKRPWLEGDTVRVPGEILSRIERAANFLLDVSAEKNEIFQIGDNDSGRLFKFLPSMDFLSREALAPLGPRPDCGLAAEPFERVNDHAHLAGAIAGLLPRMDLLAMAPAHPDTEIVRGLACGSATAEAVPLRPRPELRAYGDFGLFITEREGWRMALRCGPNGQSDNGGHAHNDQLSVCLAVNRKLLLVDPGTYVYTPLPEQRNAFRSTRYHNTLFIPKIEQNSFTSTSLFTLFNEALPELLECTSEIIRARHIGFGAHHTRAVQLFSGGGMEVRDECPLPGCRLALHLHPQVAVQRISPNSFELRREGTAVVLESPGLSWTLGKFLYSPGYGLALPAPRLESASFSGDAVWRLLPVRI
jgi:hypothetical protein